MLSPVLMVMSAELEGLPMMRSLTFDDSVKLVSGNDKLEAKLLEAGCNVTRAVVDTLLAARNDKLSAVNVTLPMLLLTVVPSAPMTPLNDKPFEELLMSVIAPEGDNTLVDNKLMPFQALFELVPVNEIVPVPVVLIVVGEKADLIPLPMAAVPFMVMLPPDTRLKILVLLAVVSSIPFQSPVVTPVKLTLPPPVLISLFRENSTPAFKPPVLLE